MVRLTRKERRDRLREARRGRIPTKDLTPLGYAAFREARKLEKKKRGDELKKKKQEENLKKQQEKQRIGAEKEAKRQSKSVSIKGGKLSKPGSKFAARVKLLLLLLVIAALIYAFFKYKA